MAATNGDIVVYGLTMVGGAGGVVHTEEVAAKCAVIAPDSFGWQLAVYRDRNFADKEAARRALASARKSDRVDGNYNRKLSRDGWLLTNKGLEWLHKNAAKLEKELGLTSSLTLADSIDRERMKRRFENDPMFRLFVDHGSLEDVAPEDVARMLGVGLHWPRERIIGSFERLEIEAQLAKEPDVTTFLKACRQSLEGL